MGKLDFEKEFASAEPKRVQILRYMREAIGKDEVTWSDLTTLNLRKVRNCIREGVSGNSACTYLGVLKAFLAHYADEGLIPCHDPGKELKGKKEPSQHVALTEEEIMKWDSYQPKNDCEKDVKILFMRGCLTGARYSDCKKLSTTNIKNDRLVYVSQKTKTEVVQPIHHLLMKYLDRQPSKERKPAVVNRVISRICKNLGINEETTLFVSGKLKTAPKYEFISSHSARRSYVTMLVTRGVPITVVSKLAGHSSTAMTDKYACVDTRKLSDDTMAFFNG